MDFTFDSGKNATNLRKHGISLADAEKMDFDTAIFVHDQRYEYGEQRMQALGLLQGRLHMLVFTMRGETLRVISLRKANAKEAKRFEQQT